MRTFPFGQMRDGAQFGRNTVCVRIPEHIHGLQRFHVLSSSKNAFPGCHWKGNFSFLARAGLCLLWSQCTHALIPAGGRGMEQRIRDGKWSSLHPTGVLRIPKWECDGTTHTGFGFTALFPETQAELARKFHRGHVRK